MALVPAHLAPVTNKTGFYLYWLKLVEAGMTRQQAYDETERVHDFVLGGHMHSDFRTFDRRAWRNKAKAKTTSAQIPQ